MGPAVLMGFARLRSQHSTRDHHATGDSSDRSRRRSRLETWHDADYRDRFQENARHQVSHASSLIRLHGDPELDWAGYLRIMRPSRAIVANPLRNSDLSGRN